MALNSDISGNAHNPFPLRKLKPMYCVMDILLGVLDMIPDEYESFQLNRMFLLPL